MVTTIFRKRRQYSVANVDVYSGLAFGLAEASCLALRVMGKPYVLTLHGGNLPNFSKRWPRRVRRLLDRAKAVTTPSSYLQEAMQGYRNDIELLPNPLSLENYVFRSRAPAEPRLIWLRSFHEIYNPTLAIRVLADLKRSFPNVHLTMIGPDKGDGSFQATQRLATELGVADQVDFTGGVPKAEIPGYLNGGDLFINTTNIDNTPISVLEAMACGLCVVTTNVGGIPHLVTHEINGLLVDPDNSQAMSAAIQTILQDQEKAGQLSNNAREHASRFDWQAILPRWIDLFHQLDR
jgi:glycosyltransferase involved in cell wall biosynthesis